MKALLETMRGSYDRAVVSRAFAQVNRLFVAQVPSIQLFVWKGSYVTSDRVEGYEPNLLTSFDDMMNVDTSSAPP